MDIKLPLTEKWVMDNIGDLTSLAIHLGPKDEDGNVTFTGNMVDGIVRDLLSDVLDVWLDAHKHNPCESCSNTIDWKKEIYGESKLKCEMCKCNKLKVLFPPNTDICQQCQDELKIEAELNEARVAQHVQWLNDQQDEEAADSECHTLPDGDCIAPNCKLHGPVAFVCTKCDEIQTECKCE